MDNYRPEQPMNRYKHATVIGCGTTGLPCAVALAMVGVTVTGVDTDVEYVTQLSKGHIDRLDDGLSQGLAKAISGAMITFSSAIVATSAPTAFIIAVPTPIDSEEKPIMTYLQAAVDQVLACAQDEDLVVLRATCPIGTTRQVANRFRDQGRKLLVAACPDRTVAGRSFREQRSVPAIVGGIDASSTRAATGLFQQLGLVVEVGSPETAEAIKLFCNVQRDITFAVANQFALICEHLGLDFEEVWRSGSYRYPRFSLTRPGPVGGPCLSKDGFLLRHSVADSPRMLSLALTARHLNQSVVDFVADAVCSHAQKTGSHRPVMAVLGLAFKGEPPTSDQRQSFGIAIIAKIRTCLPDADIRTWDPSVPSADMDEEQDRAVGAAHVVILANDHPTLSRLDLDRTARLMAQGGLIYDACGRNLNCPEQLPNSVEFHSFGKCFRVP